MLFLHYTKHTSEQKIYLHKFQAKFFSFFSVRAMVGRATMVFCCVGGVGFSFFFLFIRYNDDAGARL